MPLIFPRDFEQDGLATSRFRPFELDSSFRAAKEATIRDVGEDFQIDYRSYVFIWALKSTSQLRGASVELGTGRAWMFSFALNHPEIESLGEVFLIDRFSKLSVDKNSGKPIPGFENSYYTDDVRAIKARFSKESGVRVIQGEIPDVLKELEFSENGIRFLHLDLNAASPEVEGLRFLWSRVMPGGIILLDDYGSVEFVESRIAMDNLSKELNFQILSLPTGQGLVIRR